MKTGRTVLVLAPLTASDSSHGLSRGSQVIKALGLIGDPAPGVSSCEAVAEVKALIKQLPEGIGHEWSGQSFQERQSGSQAPLLYAVSIIFVFLSLAALYESWSVPFFVMLVVPVGDRYGAGVHVRRAAVGLEQWCRFGGAAGHRYGRAGGMFSATLLGCFCTAVFCTDSWAVYQEEILAKIARPQIPFRNSRGEKYLVRCLRRYKICGLLSASLLSR